MAAKKKKTKLSTSLGKKAPGITRTKRGGFQTANAGRYSNLATAVRSQQDFQNNHTPWDPNNLSAGYRPNSSFGTPGNTPTGAAGPGPSGGGQSYGNDMVIPGAGGSLSGGTVSGGSGGDYTPAGAPPLQQNLGPSQQMFQGVYDRATGGSINSYNTAANRLRERLDASTAGNVDQASNRNLGRGFGNSGLNNADMFRERQAGQMAYGQGLAGLSDMFEKNRLTGLGIAGQAAGGEADREQGIDSILYDLLNNREGRGSNEKIAQLLQKNENYRNDINAGVQAGGSSTTTTTGSGSSTGVSGYQPTTRYPLPGQSQLPTSRPPIILNGSSR